MQFTGKYLNFTQRRRILQFSLMTWSNYFWKRSADLWFGPVSVSEILGNNDQSVQKWSDHMVQRVGGPAMRNVQSNRQTLMTPATSGRQPIIITRWRTCVCVRVDVKSHRKQETNEGENQPQRSLTNTKFMAPLLNLFLFFWGSSSKNQSKFKSFYTVR